MRKASLGIAPEGGPLLGLLTIGTLMTAMLDWDVLSVIFFGLLVFSVHFFRDPERVVPHEAGVAVSPADGKIIRITKRESPITGQPMTCISIFMNVFSVHVNRSPVAGQVQAIAYQPGAFVNAAWDKASTGNERCAYHVRDTENKDWVFVQISGLIARRIVCRTEVGDNLARGERFGMIRFGSRVDLYVPEGYDPAVSIGDVVFAGQSPIATQNTTDKV